MKKVLLRLAIKLNKERKRRQVLHKIVQAMAALVVFCTTYALILPAITMEQERLCGLQAHAHGDGCYESYAYYALSCTVTEDARTLLLHSHGRECYDRDGVLCCTLPERPAHTHGPECYGEMLPGYAEAMSYTGTDHSVSVTLTPQAQIPRNARLSVRELLPGTEEYDACYRQTVDSLLMRTNAVSEEDLGVSFARFFDIGFTVNGASIEPQAPVAVEIRYAQPIALAEEQSGTAVHFADSGIELLNAALSAAQAPAEPALTEAVSETTPETNPGTVPETEEAPPSQAAQTAAVTHVDTFAFTQNSFSVVGTVLANARIVPATVWLDGTCGGLMAFGGSDNLRLRLEDGRLPTSWKSPTKYAYTLKGWYDVTHGIYYPLEKAEDGTLVGPVADVPNNTVFYADWVAADYGIGQPNSHTVNSLDTNEFVTTHLFDYNSLFNVQSVRLSGGSADNRSHSESWTQVELGEGRLTHNGTQTLDFVFRDHDGSSTLSHPTLPDGNSTRNEPSEFNAIYSGLYTANLGNLLFDPGTQVMGKTYLGQGNYLFQYEEDPASDHYGYYYYDSSRNAAAYNADMGRFYVYDYKVYAQDTIGNDLHHQNADFLPLNYPPSGTDLNGQIVYASQAGQNPSTMANLNFGMSTNIHFYLPNRSGATDANGNYLNKSTTGDPMVFEFSGDDDVWVLLDGQLLLDIGGIHQVRSGIIDFSAGVVRTTRDGSADLDNMQTRTIEEILGAPVPEGPHNLTIYYLERGSSMSNCAIYFNLAPRYGLDITKTDYITGQPLPGVVFAVFNDADCTVPATLWNSHDEAKADSQNSPFLYSTNTFITGQTGTAHMWGLVAGKTYYLREQTVPEGYPVVSALIRVTLNNHGTDISEITVIRTGEGTEGFEVTAHSMNKETHLISLQLTNKRTTDPLTAIRTEKQWGNDTALEVPVQVYLMANGTPVGQDVTLSADNAWGHTWMDLPLRDASGNTIIYTADERPLAGYTRQTEKTLLDTDRISWIKVGVLDNSAIFLLSLDDATALSGEGGTFRTSASLNDAWNSSAFHWRAEAYEDGFRLYTADGFRLAFHNEASYFYLTSGSDGNQTFYYDGSHLFVMSGNSRFCPSGVRADSLTAAAADTTFLYKQVITRQGTTLFRFTNTAIPEERRKPLMLEKVWEGDAPGIPEKVTVRILKDDALQALVELTAENQWKATVEGLDSDLLSQGGYTLEEDVPFGFTPVFSDITENTVDQWLPVTGSEGLVAGETYVFVTGSRALADNNGTPRATSYSGTPAENQRWQAVQSSMSDGSTIQVLKNVATGRYLREYGYSQYDHEFTLVDKVDANCAVRLRNSRLQYYPQSDGGGWSVTISSDGSLSRNPGWGTGSGTVFTVSRREYHSEYLVTLTNTYGTYVLPETGGTGTAPCYTFGGLLTAAAAMMYCYQPKRRRQKGGR